MRINHVRHVQIIQTAPDDFHNNYKDRDCRFVFDIDSTITRGHPGILSKESKPVLNLLKAREYWIHFATGRRDGDVHEMIKYCETEPEGIAENGGLIILSETRVLSFGHKEEPNKAFGCLKEEYGNRIKQDIKQGSRRTERIIKNNLTKQEYEKCTKKYNVEVLASKTSYHIVEKHVNKGTALRKLIHDRGWNEDYIVSVGDSDLDVPMFREADTSFAVGNSSAFAKKSASHVLDNDFEQGIKEMFDVWFNI